MKNKPLMRRVLHWGLRLFIFVFIFIIILYFILPPLLSSDRAREKASRYLAKAFQRPVVMRGLVFSWKEGFFISQLNITNRDQTPFFVLHSVQLLPDWRALLAKKFKAASLTIKGVAITIIRDKTGKIRGDDRIASLPRERTGLADKESSPLTSPDSIALRPKKNSGIYKGFSALFLDAHITEGIFTFIDQRLNTTTQIKIFSAGLNVRSLTQPIKFFLQGTVVLNNNPPEPLKISGSALLFSKKKINLLKARGTLAMEAGFGHMEGFFDLDKFNTSSTEATGGRLVCSLDLDKLSQVLAGILGFPPGHSWKGTLRSSLEARGNFDSRIAITGATQLTNVSLSGGPFQQTPFEQLRIDSSQDILFDFTAQKINVNVFDLTSAFAKLSFAGTIDNFQKDPYSNLTLTGTGDLHEMVLLLGNFFHLPSDLNLYGRTQLAFSGTGSAKNFHLKGAAAVKGLSIEHPALNGRPFQEETLLISPDLACNLKKPLITITSLLIQGKSLTGEIKGTVDRHRDIDLEGTLSLKCADLKNQLLDVLPRGFPGKGESSSAFTIKGNLENSIRVTGDHDLPLLPKLRVTHDLIYSPGQDTLAFTTFTAKSSCLSFSGQGTLAQIFHNPFATCEGELTLALEEVQKVWKDSLPKKMILQGNGRVTFSAKGTLTPIENKPDFSSWTGKGALFLEAASYQGLGTIQKLKSTECRLDKGVLTVALKGLLNNGPSTVQGSIDFNQKKPVMNLKGQGEDSDLSQDQTLLGYVIPISSHATQVTGKGSFFLQASWEGTDWVQEISRSIIGEGKITLNDGTIKSEGDLNEILSVLGKSETIQFDQILCPFRLGEGRIYDNTIQVTGPDIELALQGWTSLTYDPEKKGNPIKYKVTGASLKQSLGKDAQKILPFLGNRNAAIPIVITGTVQKPKVSVKFPKAKKFFKNFFNPPKNSSHDLEGT